MHETRSYNAYMDWLIENDDYRQWCRELKIFTIKVGNSFNEKKKHIHKLRLAVRRGINNSR